MKNVQCESCHGSVGSEENSIDSGHTDRTTDFSAENCGECHQGEHHPYLEQWQESMHAESDVAFFTRENNGDCYYCHYAQDFVAFLKTSEYDGTTFEPQGDLQNLTCATCHNPHGNDNPGNIRAVPEGHEGHVICDVCHNAEIEGEVDVESTPHHTTSEVLDGSPKFGYQYEGEEYSNSYHSNIEERCIACHVHSTPFDGEEANTGHTFEPRIEACQECHNDYDLEEGNFDYRGTQTMVQNLADSLKTKLDMANASDSTTDAFKRANYNCLSVQAEGSMGIHNTSLVVGLLEDALAKFTPTSVQPEEGAVPQKFELSQNYPNPFNPKTNIKFSVPEPTNVRVVVYNTLGKEVTTLVDKQMSTGTYTVSWDGSNYSSGIYLYKLETDNFSQVKKMLLVK